MEQGKLPEKIFVMFDRTESTPFLLASDDKKRLAVRDGSSEVGVYRLIEKAHIINETRVVY
jgi:hypothetical protein